VKGLALAIGPAYFQRNRSGSVDLIRGQVHRSLGRTLK